MRAVVVGGPGVGGAELLQLADVPDPSPGPGEVLIDVAAAGVNRADLLQREGRYPPPPGASEVLGLEVSGTVSALGEGSAGTAGWQVGDEVCALLAGGGYAERVVVPAGQVLPVPAGVSLVDAAALPEAVATVWSSVFMTAGLRPGEVLLVHGGASGIGTMAVQVASAVGARVAVTAGSPARLAACAALGASVLVDHTAQDFVEVVRSATDGHGADVVLDVVGGPYLGRHLDVLATGGRLVVLAVQGGRRAELDLGVLMTKRATVVGSTLRSRPAAEKADICASVLEHVWPLLAQGRVRPVVHARLPLERAAQAHELVEGGAQVGKVLLVVDGRGTL